MAVKSQAGDGIVLNGEDITTELLRNMEEGQFATRYSVILPAVYHVYLNPEDHGRIESLLDSLAADARRALAERVAQWNKRWFSRKKYKIEAGDWFIHFHADGEGVVPPGDIHIYSTYAPAKQREMVGAMTTRVGKRTAPVRQHPDVAIAATRRESYAVLQFEDQGGPRVFQVSQNAVKVGRGGPGRPVDVTVLAGDDISRQHLEIRRDPATRTFCVVDLHSSNGTAVNGKKIPPGVETPLPEKARIGLANEALILHFEVTM